MGVREGPSSRIIARAPRDVKVLDGFMRELLALHAVERRMIAKQLDGLALDALPRGAEALEGRHRDHLRLRVGRFRILYKVMDGELTVVALVAGE